MKKILTFEFHTFGLGAAALARFRAISDFKLPPANWTVVSRNDVKDKPDVVKGTFEAAEKDKTLLDLPRSL